MAYLVVDKDETECITTHTPIRMRKFGKWGVAREFGSNFVELPPGFIKKLIGRELTWDDEPVKI
jgi:hypothetical protein